MKSKHDKTIFYLKSLDLLLAIVLEFCFKLSYFSSFQLLVCAMHQTASCFIREDTCSVTCVCKCCTLLSINRVNYSLFSTLKQQVHLTVQMCVCMCFFPSLFSTLKHGFGAIFITPSSKSSCDR